LLTVGLLAHPAWAAELTQVRIFVGEDHAQLLLVSDGVLSQGQVRSTPRSGRAPARATVTLTGMALSDELKQAYTQDGRRYLIPVDQGGVRRVVLAPIGNDLQVSVELDSARNVIATPIEQRGLLLDLRVQGATPDPSLPDAGMLGSWLAGASLSRQAEQLGNPRLRIVVDPGHGGWDSGAVGLTGTHEADIALQLSLRLARELERRLGAEVYLTRSDDTFVPLKERARYANSLNADLFLSIHANASPTQAGWGIETYYLDTASGAGAARVAARENAIAAEEQAEGVDRIVLELEMAGINRLSRLLAMDLQRSVITQLQSLYGEDQIRDLGVKTALFYVLHSTTMPSILFEASFLTHPDDEMRLRHPLFQQTVAESIAAAVEQYLERQHGR
jgi:N-acetylmuramoyl-L-alanine amidase